ncbi:CDP-diacylglycerol--inositol 3-phosphatidyltransferase [Piromyces finnis]|uniref:CDP-diacylglycerol--inositol 3-phosphatidyltransferase n=1 Tax=Piromyces finnis TaxID=1754191 RepID=A0A1Y1UVV2_9FUNG|nr:CDP-diacylglycerol--inositol 3-phosphatidyltransferase [Piromyces finnis]|eukprot:ORX42144.1 CDP-diacylglycerol--inositol 3-phosphatidyltransferase [Piromyces finnis]
MEAIDNFAKKQTRVYMFMPNLIGYTRVILAFLSFLFLPCCPITAMTCYSLSCILDALDGTAARRYNQCSQFGAVLDMITDRFTSSALICYLAMVWPKWTFVFQFLIALDFSSHYFHMYSSLASGSPSHKILKEDAPKILKLYYSDRRVLFTVCFFNEAYYVLLYLSSAYYGTIFTFQFWAILSWIFLPVFVFKQSLNVIQMLGACLNLLEADEKKIKESQEKAN